MASEPCLRLTGWEQWLGAGSSYGPVHGPRGAPTVLVLLGPLCVASFNQTTPSACYTACLLETQENLQLTLMPAFAVHCTPNRPHQ